MFGFQEAQGHRRLHALLEDENGEGDAEEGEAEAEEAKEEKPCEEDGEEKARRSWSLEWRNTEFF